MLNILKSTRRQQKIEKITKERKKKNNKYQSICCKMQQHIATFSWGW